MRQTKGLGEADFGTGIYSFPLAARLISRAGQVSPNTVRYWFETGLATASFGRGHEGSDVLSFLDLVSLEIVRLFRFAGVSLQRVRKLEVRLRETYPGMPRPFAHEVFFTDGSSVWHQLHPDDHAVVEILGRRREQAAWKPFIRSFAEEIRYEGGVAAVWYPGKWVEVNPRIQFGSPVVKGTRLPVSVIEKELKVAPQRQVADWHGLTVAQVKGVRDYLKAAA